MESLIIAPILMAEIQGLSLELQRMRDKMYDLCENDKTEVQLRDIPRDTDDNNGPQKHKRYINLRWEVLWFFDMIMKVRTDKTLSVISVCVRTPTKVTYGFQFDLNVDRGTYSLVRFYLPYSLNAREELQKGKDLQASELKRYVSDIQTNIYAFSMRKEQFDAFTSAYEMNEVILDFSLSYTRITLQTYVKFRQKRHHVQLEFVYKFKEILPVLVNQNITPKFHVHVKDDFLDDLKVFEQLDFQVAYEKAFIHSQLFTYC